MNQKLPGQSTQNTPALAQKSVQLPEKYYPPNVIRLSKIICAFITESKYIFIDTAIFYFLYCLSFIFYSHPTRRALEITRFFLILFSLLFLSRNLGKRRHKKTCRPMQSLVRISTARADAHNTIAPFRHTSPSYKNK
jgi:hypothetical protein